MVYEKLGLGLVIATLSLGACQDNADIKTGEKTQMTSSNASSELAEVKFKKYTLDNGLDVILHVDRSDPIVAINLAAHVGSAREITGRTGFAHLFEHLLFLDSENLGYGGLDNMNTRIGGEGTNGFTTNDMTQYFQAVPKDALEKVIWAEADKIGYFINTVTQPVIDKEKQVVKNEKRQRVDNQPYGHRWYIVGKALYGADHPYNWQVIGSLEDLEAATLMDVKNFYKKWYVPNNVTVTLTGDFDVEQAETWINKYFGEIPRGADVEEVVQRASGLTENVSLYYEDNFATVPQLVLVWPSVPQYHKDSYALDILTTYLTDGKRAPYNEVLVDEEKLTSQVGTFHNSSEIAGELYVIVNGKDEADLDALIPALQKAAERFEENGISQSDLDKIKTAQEVDFYENLQSALGKAIQLGQYNTFTNDPGFINQDIKNIQAVTTADVMRVYNTYMKNKPHLKLSVVPKKSAGLALEGAELAEITLEKVVQGAEKDVVDDGSARNFEPTPSSFDRSVEPAFGPAFTLPSPKIWKSTLGDGLRVAGMETNETPLVDFTLTIAAGLDHGNVDKPAVARLTADILEKGTALKTTAELEDAINALGSSISINAGSLQTQISGTTLSRNFDETIALVKEMLTEPRWDEEEFSLLISKTVDDIESSEKDPGTISIREFSKILYPSSHMFSNTFTGSVESVKSVTMDDLKAFYAANYSPKGAVFNVVGDINQAQVETAAKALQEGWNTPAPAKISLPLAVMPTASKVYFYDVPGSKQSVLRFGYPSLSAVHPDYASADAMNYLLGNIYTSRLMTELRVNKGYTYGIRSGFTAGKDRGVFTVRSNVRANVTLEASQLVRDIVKNYGTSFSEEDLGVMKSALIKGQALSSETLSAKLGMLDEISTFGYADDYQAQNSQMIGDMGLDDIKRLTDTYLKPDTMYYLIVGDAKTQAARMKDLGYGEPVMINP
jgi:zinc protease